VSIDLGGAIKATNEILAGNTPPQRTASVLFLALVLSAVFFLLPRLESTSSFYLNLSPMILGGLAVKWQHIPPQLWMSIEYFLYFAVSIAIVLLFFVLFRSRIETDPKTDALSPIREELVKIQGWTLLMNGFHDSAHDSRSAKIELTMNSKWKKLSLKFIIQNGMAVRALANDVSLQLLDGGQISLLFVVEDLAVGADNLSEDFDYLLTVKGSQPDRNSKVTLNGQWYRLSERREGYGQRGPCELTSD
jgi:hypothetical protein